MQLLSGSDVLEKIDPVDPDNLQREGTTDIWVAKWCPPILEGDLEALRRTPGIKIESEGDSTELKGWYEVRFTVEDTDGETQIS